MIMVLSKETGAWRSWTRHGAADIPFWLRSTEDGIVKLEELNCPATTPARMAADQSLVENIVVIKVLSGIVQVEYVLRSTAKSSKLM